MSELKEFGRPFPKPNLSKRTKEFDNSGPVPDNPNYELSRNYGISTFGFK